MAQIIPLRPIVKEPTARHILIDDLTSDAYQPTELAPIRGILNGMFFGACVWAMVGLLAYWWFSGLLITQIMGG